MTRHSRIDTTASAIITDADTFPPESTTPNKDDQRQGIYPLRVYEGYNYLPTAYGYKSYFGTDAVLAANGLVSPDVEVLVVEEIFVYQTRVFENVVVALTSHGIFLRSGTDWEHVISLTPPDTGTSLPWTITTAAQLLFMYRQGAPAVYVLDDLVDGVGVSMDTFAGMAVQPTRADASTTEPVHVYEFVPTVLNMAGQIGMFRAGGSLGFWDSDNSIAWSAINDFTDFEPSLATLANITKLQDQIGSITTIKPHGDGFIVYCTRSVLYAREDSGALLRYSTKVVLGSVGVAYPREVAIAEPDTTHYAFTSAGLMEITGGRAQPIVPDFSDYVKRTRLPQYMTMLNNRYLCVQVLDPNFIPGNVQYSVNTVDPEDYKYDGSEVGGVNIPGFTIPGGEVCFADPADGEVDPGATLAGIKPYHLLQFYTHFLYTGAQFTFTRTQFGNAEVTSITIRRGTVNPRFDVIPVSLTAAEVADFNATTQLDALVQRQTDAYAAAYDPIDFQAIYDEYVAAAPSVGNTYEILSEGTVSQTPNPNAFREVPSGFINVGDRIVWQNIDGDNANDAIAGLDGLLYLNRNTATGAGPDIPMLDTNQFVIQFPELEFFLKDAFSAGYNFYAAVGTLAEIDYTPIDIGADFAQRTWRRSAGKFDPYPLDPQFATFSPISEEDTIRVLDPTSVGALTRFNVDGAKLAYKLATNQAAMLEFKDQNRLENVTIARQIPISFNYQWYTGNARTIAQVNFTATLYSEIPVFKGTLRALNGSGSTLETFNIETPIGNDVLPDFTLPVTSSRDTDPTTAYNAMFAAVETGRQNLLVPIVQAAQSAYLQAIADAEAQANAVVGVASIVWDDRSSINDNIVPGPSVSDGLNSPYIATFNWNETVTDSVFATITLRERRIVEEVIDVTPEMYGELPFALPTTASNAAAYNAMTDDQKAGLITVFQHFYNINNSKDAPDASFLITAAGREEVPLGSAVGSVQEVIDDADFANRYYEFAYVGDGGEGEFGAGFTVPGKTEGEVLAAEQGLICGITDAIVIDDFIREPVVYPEWEIEVPTATFVLQNGSRAPFNPTLHGAFVFDLHLQKWGVFRGDYKHLIDYQPVNNYTPGSVAYKNFMVDGGILSDTLEVALFNDYPSDNVLRYGKYQHVGSEFCAIEEVHAEFGERSTGLIAVQFSLDARRLEYGLSVARWYNEALSTTLNCDIVGRWATIAFTGHFDLAGLRVKSNPSGRR